MRRSSHIIPVVIIVSALACSCRTNNRQENNAGKELWSVRMANSEMKRFPSLWMVDFQKEKRWNYTQGLEGLAFLRLYETTGDKKYFDYARGFADSLISPDGTILGYKMSNYNIDQINPGRMLFILYDNTGDRRYRMVIDTLRQQLRTQPRTPGGGFWHKKIYPEQMWLDGLYMGEPFYAEYARRYNEPADYADIINQFRLAALHTFDPATGLFRHAWDSSHTMPWADKETGQSPHAWGRAMGWFAMAIVDVLDYIPENQTDRNELIKTLNTLAEGIVKFQDPATGGWYQVTDRPGDKGNYIETSCTSMFTYALLKGVRKGYLDKKYLANADKAYQGLIKNFITTNADGTINLTGVCSVAGLGGKPYRDGSYSYYISEPVRSNDPKGVAPFIMASIEYENSCK